METNVRDKIVDAALELLRERGPSGFRVQDVAKRAEVSPTLLYYYFDGRKAVIAAAYAKDYAEMLERDLDRIQTALTRADDPDSFFQGLLNTAEDGVAPMSAERRRRTLDVLASAQHDPNIAASIVAPHRRYLDGLTSVVEQCQQRGWLPSTLDARSYALAWLALPFGLSLIDVDPDLGVNLASYLGVLVSGTLVPGSAL